MEGETCGIDEITGVRSPKCGEGLDCIDTGAGKICEKIVIYATLGGTCGGFNEFTAEPFPDCEPGLVCEDSGIFGIPGAQNVCKIPSPSEPELAKEGETCGGINEITGEPFPDCEEGLVCMSSDQGGFGLVIIGGSAGDVC